MDINNNSIISKNQLEKIINELKNEKDILLKFDKKKNEVKILSMQVKKID